MTKVIEFPGVTRISLSPARVIERAVNANLSSVVIVGFCADGSEFFASSDADGGAVLWHLERAKMKLLQVPETHFGDEE